MDMIERLQQRAEALLRYAPVARIVEREQRARFVANRDRNLFLGVYDSWDEAAAAAAGYGTAGYDNAPSAQLYDHRLRIDAHDYPALYWIRRSRDDGLHRVVDLGGAIGIKFIAFREALAPWPQLVWTVHDVPAMLEHGAALAAERGDAARLRFERDFDALDGACDLLYASGVLQYLPRTLPQMLDGWRERPRRIVVNTAAIHPEREYYTVNSLGTAFCPYRVQTQARLVAGLRALGYRLREAWVNPGKALEIPHRPEFSLDSYGGYCFDLGSSSPTLGS